MPINRRLNDDTKNIVTSTRTILFLRD